MKTNYDSKYDILYINLGDSVNSIADEEEAGIIVRRDRETKNVTGVTIMGVREKYMKDTEMSNKYTALLEKYIQALEVPKVYCGGAGGGMSANPFTPYPYGGGVGGSVSCKMTNLEYHAKLLESKNQIENDDTVKRSLPI